MVLHCAVSVALSAKPNPPEPAAHCEPSAASPAVFQVATGALVPLWKRQESVRAMSLCGGGAGVLTSTVKACAKVRPVETISKAKAHKGRVKKEYAIRFSANG